jgi:hypothetical protein
MLESILCQVTEYDPEDSLLACPYRGRLCGAVHRNVSVRILSCHQRACAVPEGLRVGNRVGPVKVESCVTNFKSDSGHACTARLV